MKLIRSIIACLILLPTPLMLAEQPETLLEQIGSVSWTNEDITHALKKFCALYKKRPLRSNPGGMRLSHMFYTWFVTQQLQPTLIIESGVHRGQSTWLFEQAAPNAKIISIDPALEKRVYISKRATYTTKDFAHHNWSHADKDKTLCFFDDHQGSQRIYQCKQFGFKHIIYEDNYAHSGGNYTDDIAPKWSLLATRASLEQLEKIVQTYCNRNPQYASYTQRKWQNSQKNNLEREKRTASFLRNELEIYYEFPPITATDPENISWTYRECKAIMKTPLFQTPPDWFKALLEKDVLDDLRNELSHAFFAYMKLY